MGNWRMILPHFLDRRGEKNNGTYSVKNGISFHKISAMLLFEIAGLF
jgi:hypothetical protein